MRRAAVLLGAGVALAACGASSHRVVTPTNPVALAARAMAATSVSFCFDTTASAQGGQERLSGCGEESAHAQLLRFGEQLEELVAGQSASSSENVIVVGTKLWIQSKGLWYREPNVPTVVEPASLAALLERVPKFVVGRGGVVDKVQTLAYTANLSGSQLTGLIDSLPAGLRSQYQQEGIRQLSVDAELSQRGRLLAVDELEHLVDAGQQVQVVQAVVFSGFGEAVSVSPPPTSLIGSGQPSG